MMLFIFNTSLKTLTFLFSLSPFFKAQYWQFLCVRITQTFEKMVEILFKCLINVGNIWLIVKVLCI